MPDIFSCTPPSVKADGNSSSVTSCGTSDAHTGALTAKPRPSTNTPTRSSIGFRMPAQPRNAKAPAHPASHKLASRSIMPALKASASAPAGSVKRKNGSDARLAIREMKRPDGEIKFIIHVAAVSCAATAVPETRLANQILRKTLFRQALGFAFISWWRCFRRLKDTEPDSYDTTTVQDKRFASIRRPRDWVTRLDYGFFHVFLL